MSLPKSACRALLLAATSFRMVAAQEPRVEVGKRATAIPKVCEGVEPASIEDEVDTHALVKEALCKGAGDMLSDYTYVMSYTRRARKERGRVEEESVTYEVYMPLLTGGTHARGVLLVTSRDGVPVPAAELEKERLRAGERLEKEENKIARTHAPHAEAAHTRNVADAMLPLGMYPRTGVNRTSFRFQNLGAILDINTFLMTCELKLTRRERRNGRATLAFTFTPRPNAKFDDKEKYVAALGGMIWIDADDRIVTRLAGWPSADATKKARVTVKEKEPVAPALPTGQGPPAILVEMARIPEGVWLPHVIQLNGFDYPRLFNDINYSINFTYDDYKRFNTETKDVKLTPLKPR